MIGSRVWVIADGWIPPTSNGPAPAMISHESACMLNASDDAARVEVTVYFEDRDPIGPFEWAIPAQRTRHERFNDLTDPQSIPLGTNYAVVLRSTVPIVVQHTRLDSRQAENALMTTVAYPSI